jgi:hypothetical protein
MEVSDHLDVNWCFKLKAEEELGARIEYCKEEM